MYRKVHTGLSWDAYLDEPRDVVLWDLAFQKLEADLEEAAIRREQAKTQGPFR